ncbi:MAG TPA: VWA domain-containing protein [Acidobacteriota bacterium]
MLLSAALVMTAVASISPGAALAQDTAPAGKSVALDPAPPRGPAPARDPALAQEPTPAQNPAARDPASAQDPTPAQEPAAQDGGEVVIPGGARFVRAAAGMPPADPARGDADDTLLVELARHLSAPLVLDYGERVARMVAELRALQDFQIELDQRHGPVVPSLAEPGSPAHAKAVELLDFLGFQVLDEGGRIQLQRRVGDRQARQRQMLGYLGVSVPLQSRLWAAGEPIELAIRDERAPLLFGAAAWNEQVFGRDLDGEALFDALVSDRRARQILAGYTAVDRPTRELLFAAIGLRPLHRDAALADGFLQLAPYLRAAEGGLVLPGGDRDAWQAILGPWEDTAQLIAVLIGKDGGRAAHLWRALSLVPEGRARYLLTMGHETGPERAAWSAAMYRSIRMPDFGRTIRWPEDLAELFVNLHLRQDGGGIDWPGGGRIWRAALAGDDPLEAPGALETLLARFEAGPDSGPEVDAEVLRAILDASDPDHDGPTAIRKYLAVSAAIRYQPIGAMRPAIPLLYRNYRRFGRAYFFFVMPTPLPEGAAQTIVRRLQEVDGIERDAVRIDAIRQLQASLLLLREMLLNDLLTDDDRGELLSRFLAITPSAGTAAGRRAASEGYGTALTEWWRTELVPALARGLAANGWPGNVDDLRSVVVTALVGRMGVAGLEVDGIDYEYTPATLRGRRMYTHLLMQQQPSFEGLFRLDELAVALGEGDAEPAESADEIETIVAEMKAQMPPNIGDEEVTEALPVTLARDQLFERAGRLVAELRGAGPAPASLQAFREAVSVYLGDALVGIAYALHMGDPQSFTYQQAHIAWLHRLVIAELRGGGPEDLFSPWAATSESWILDEGSRLHNSLFGAPEALSRWNLEDLMASGGSRDPAAAETWAATFARIHLPSLTAEAQRVVARRHALATSWIREAVAARDAAHSPSFWVSADPERPSPELLASLRPLLRPDQLQALTDAIGAGREAEALDLISDGNRYLLLLGLDDYDAAAPAAARWLIDQMVGMPVSRRGDYVGLTTPPPVPYGEAGDQLADRLQYARLFDIRVRLAVLMEEQGLPATLHARLLMEAMARVLSSMTPASWEPWRNVLAAIDREVTGPALRQWMVDLAFADELTPTDPNVALSDVAVGGAGGAPAGRTGMLGLPVDPQQYQAAFGAAVDIVTVDIGVWDDDDNFVADLTVDDLVVTRDGEPVTPAFLRLEGSADPSVFLDDLPAEVARRVAPAPRNFVLVADLLTTSPQDWERILLDLTEFVRAGISAEDRLALVTIDQRGIPMVSHDFTIDHESVAELLEAQVGNSFATSDREQSFVDLTAILCDNGNCTNPEDPEACEPISTSRFFQCVTSAPDWEEMKFQLAQSQLGRWAIEAEINAERVMAALTQVSSMLDLGDPYDRQKYVVLLSSGFESQPGSIHYSTLVEYASWSEALNPLEVRTINSDLGQEIAGLAERLRRCRCTVYTLATLGQAAFSETSVLSNSTPVVSRFSARSGLQGPLNALARDTGGKPFFGSDMSLGFRDVLDDSRLRYVLGFNMEEPAPDAEPVWYEIEVRVARDDVDVRHRRGFYWPRR